MCFWPCFLSSALLKVITAAAAEAAEFISQENVTYLYADVNSLFFPFGVQTQLTIKVVFVKNKCAD